MYMIVLSIVLLILAYICYSSLPPAKINYSTLPPDPSAGYPEFDLYTKDTQSAAMHDCLLC